MVEFAVIDTTGWVFIIPYWVLLIEVIVTPRVTVMIFCIIVSQYILNHFFISFFKPLDFSRLISVLYCPSPRSENLQDANEARRSRPTRRNGEKTLNNFFKKKWPRKIRILVKRKTLNSCRSQKFEFKTFQMWDMLVIFIKPVVRRRKKPPVMSKGEHYVARRGRRAS